jgi:hypothetical protein
MSRIFFLIALFGVLPGCKSWFVPTTPTWPWGVGHAFCPDSGCTDQSSMSAIAKAQLFCRQVNNYYESGEYRANMGQVVIGSVGAVAGLVVAPMASGSGKVIATGISGAANTTKNPVADAFASSFSVKIRAAVDDAADAGYADFQRQQTNALKVASAVNMARACATSSSNAEKDIIKAVVN